MPSITGRQTAPLYIQHADRYPSSECYAYLGDVEKSLDALEISLEHQHVLRNWLGIASNPELRMIQEHPRFAAMDEKARAELNRQREHLAQLEPRGQPMSFFDELKRRNVIRVGIAYVIVAWLILQFADVVLNNIEAPDWVFQAIMLVLGIGLPVVLLFAWAFEMTPEGIKKEKDVERTESITPVTGKN